MRQGAAQPRESGEVDPNLLNAIPRGLVRGKSSSQRVERAADETGFKIDGDPLPSSRVRNTVLLGVDRSKPLPRIPSTWRYWVYFAVSALLIAGIVAGVTLGAMRDRSHSASGLPTGSSAAQATVPATQTPSDFVSTPTQLDLSTSSMSTSSFGTSVSSTRHINLVFLSRSK
ncbi:hypothetical protein BD779DRAFT_1475533 [Infundibulicybe gibba]|nr:hypothetical protein BD779DRAFT_1475533 [Infundibulicybe gibba]